MVNQTTFITVADGDQLSQGYFNGIRTELAKSYIYSNKGIISGTATVQLDSKTFSANDFAVADTLLIHIESFDNNYNDASSGSVMSIYIGDGTCTATIDTSWSANTTKNMLMKCYVHNPTDYINTNLHHNVERLQDGVSNPIAATKTGMSANWITSAFTIILNGKAVHWLSSPETPQLYWN